MLDISFSIHSNSCGNDHYLKFCICRLRAGLKPNKLSSVSTTVKNILQRVQPTEHIWIPVRDQRVGERRGRGRRRGKKRRRWRRDHCREDKHSSCQLHQFTHSLQQHHGLVRWEEWQERDRMRGRHRNHGWGEQEMDSVLILFLSKGLILYIFWDATLGMVNRMQVGTCFLWSYRKWGQFDESMVDIK